MVQGWASVANAGPTMYQDNYVEQHHEELSLFEQCLRGSYNIGVILAQRFQHLPNSGVLSTFHLVIITRLYCLDYVTTHGRYLVPKVILPPTPPPPPPPLSLNARNLTDHLHQKMRDKKYFNKFHYIFINL